MPSTSITSSVIVALDVPLFAFPSFAFPVPAEDVGPPDADAPVQVAKHRLLLHRRIRVSFLSPVSSPVFAVQVCYCFVAGGVGVHEIAGKPVVVYLKRMTPTRFVSAHIGGPAGCTAFHRPVLPKPLVPRSLVGRSLTSCTHGNSTL